MKINVIYKTIVTLLGTTASYLLGGWDTALKILLLFIIIDYITGVAIGIVEKKLSSEIGGKGLLKKGSIFLVIIIAYQLDVILGNEIPLFRTAASYFYVANEGVSILENIAFLGVPLPGFMINVLNKLKEQNNELLDQKE